MANTDRLSVFISSLLDSMGFSRHMIDFRINNTRYWDVIRVSSNSSVGTIITGGKAEGTSQLGQGDIDIMSVFKLITVNSRHIDPPSPQHTVLYTEDRGAHPGYTWLRVGRHWDVDDIIEQFLVLMRGENSVTTSYLPSSDFNQIVQQYMMQSLPSSVQFQQMSGPSQPTLSNSIQMDHVHALLHLDWPIQASQWMDRCRRHGWPPESIVTAVVQCGCHVVPKGFKGSSTEHMEWCISFAVHEKSILQLFNLTQKHVYILLKIIAKDLKERFPDLQDLLTSYTMKTVALWQVELHHGKDWDRPHLMDRLMEALDFLKSCVESQNLPAYFIMENNLFDGKINDFTAARVSCLVNNLLSQGAGCVLMFPSIQKQRQGLGLYWSGAEMCNLIGICCQSFLHMDLSERHILNIISMIDSPDMAGHRLLTNGVSKMMKATLAYINIAKVKKAGMSNRRKYELCRSLLHIAATNSDTDRMAGRVKFAGVLHALGKTIQAMQTLYSLNPRSLFGISIEGHVRNIIRKTPFREKTDSDNIEAVIARLGRDKCVQQCVSLDVRYTMEEINIVPDVIKYELFHVPETIWSHCGAYVDPDFMRYYLLYKCHTEQGDEANAETAFINLIRIATREGIECREVALNVLGLCYVQKEDYLRGYICFCQAMSLRPRLLMGKSSTSTPWHLAVLASKLLNRPQAGRSNQQKEYKPK